MTKHVDLAGNELFAAILEQMFTESANTTNRILDNHKRENVELRAELAAIRAGVTNLMYGDYMPTPENVLRKLYPSEEVIELFTEAVEK